MKLAALMKLWGMRLMPNARANAMSQAATAARIVQDMKAEMFDRPEMHYDRLTAHQQRALVAGVLVYADNAEQIRTPKQLHGFQCSQLVDDGWVASNCFNYEDKATPLLLDYDMLPPFVQSFLRCSLVVLMNLAGEGAWE